ncbi:hypothetical protein BDB00DRAFT_796697, partial [Zychaea mexicana]|uniref:uncharacterized protein n=1 Tax=Zychaea mexicana TaxID=64656 RepID=UPI0022FE6E51
MRRFSSRFKHREIRSLLFSSRQRKQDLVKDELLGVTPPHPAGEPIKWIHKSSHRSRKRAARLRRERERWHPNQQPTIVFYGSSRMPHFPGWAPIPHLGLIKKLASHMLLILTDEYKTSQAHAGCQQRLTSIPYDEEVCGHRKTRERATYRVEGPQGGFIPKR